jgi:hypothetical protein
VEVVHGSLKFEHHEEREGGALVEVEGGEREREREREGGRASPEDGVGC